jgi:hypothetical protein
MQEQLPPEGFSKMFDGTFISWLLGGVVGFFVWILRLEAKVKMLEKELSKNDEIVKTLNDLAVSIARIEGKLSHRDHTDSV